MHAMDALLAPLERIATFASEGIGWSASKTPEIRQ